MDVLVTSLPGKLEIIIQKTGGLGMEAEDLRCEETGRVVGKFWTLALGKFLFTGNSPFKLKCYIPYSSMIDLFTELKHRGLTWHLSRQ